jgi:uncharacterized protein with PIN domain
MSIHFGVCPYCKATVSKVMLEGITIEPNPTFDGIPYNGVSYLCHSCHSVLGVGIDPVALKNDTVAGVLKGLGRG